MRADRLGSYGNAGGLTPFLDSLAARGIVFRQAYAQSSWTNPSVASLFTSRFQSQHGVISLTSRLADSEITLAEAFHDRGYATGGFSANGMIGRNLGFGQGFDEYQALWPTPPDASHYYGQKRRADSIDELALRWLDHRRWGATKPFFLYLQYVEPHAPYSPPGTLFMRLHPGRPAPDLGMVSTWMLYPTLANPTAEQIHQAEEVYDTEVAAVDASLRELFGTLARQRCLENTVVVITADHGEEFMDHGGIGHGKTLYNEVIRVPLIVVPVGGSAPVVSDEVVSLVDIAPTLLDLAGARIPRSFEGRSLAETFRRGRAWFAPLIDGRANASESSVAFSELLPAPDEKEPKPKSQQRAIVRDGRKIIVARDGSRDTYDLRADPSERSPLTGDDGRDLASSLSAFQARLAHGQTAASPVEVDPETRARLQALGYTN